MVTSIQSTQLDFNNIKNKLKVFLAQQPEFADYDFEAAGLSNLLDVLAYNTHYNGLIANFALNESFLTTAQLRSSVVSHAESLGYTPRSRTSSIAYLNLQITNTTVGRATTVTLPANTTFTTQVDGISYVFQTLAEYTATDNGSGTYRFATSTGSFNIPVVEGRRATKTFFIGERSEYTSLIVPDENLDTTTVEVRVYASPSSSTFDLYTPLSRAIDITSDSTYYDVHEAPNGYWEVHFSDGISTGKAPTVGSKVVLSYLSSNGPLANSARSFTANSTVSMGGSNYTISTLTAVASAGGAEKESLDSIRANAPVAFASQQRLVTASDYKGVILNNYGAVRDAIAWGGEDNDPPQYGKVFVSLRFANGIDAASQQAVKDSIITDVTDNLSIMSIDTEFVDPTIVYVGCTTFFNYNPNRSTISVNIAETQVLNAISAYFTDNLGLFGATFRRSNILSAIDDLSDAILDSRMDVTVQVRFTPTLGTAKSYNLYYPVPLAAASNTAPTITSNTFIYNSLVCSIQNQLSSNKLQVVAADGTIVVDNIGSYNAATGVISLVGFNPSSLISTTDIRVKAIPANQATIKPSRNFILELDTGASTASGALDYENSRASI